MTPHFHRGGPAQQPHVTQPQDADLCGLTALLLGSRPEEQTSSQLGAGQGAVF